MTSDGKTIKAPNPFYVFQSWVNMVNAGPGGSNKYSIANYSFGSASLTSPFMQGCGNFLDMTLDGYTTIGKSLNTWSCPLQVV